MRTTTWRATAPLFIALILTAGPAAEALADIAPIRVERPKRPRQPPAEAPADKAEPTADKADPTPTADKAADDMAAGGSPDGLAAPTDDKAGPTDGQPTPAADAAEPADPAAEPPAYPAAQGEGEKGEGDKPAQINKFEAPAADAKAEGDTPTMGFEAATDEAPKENLPAWPFLYGAYTFLWLLIFAYVVFLWRKQAALEARISAVDKRMDAVDAALEALEAEA